MFQGQERPHEENNILKREIGEVIIHLPDRLICSITCLLFDIYRYLIFSFSLAVNHLVQMMLDAHQLPIYCFISW